MGCWTLLMKEAVLKEQGWTHTMVKRRGRWRNWWYHVDHGAMPAPKAYKLVTHPPAKGMAYRRRRVKRARFSGGHSVKMALLMGLRNAIRSRKDREKADGNHTKTG